jgi:hypothetical protein
MSLKWAIKVFRKIADGFASLPVGDKSGSLENWGLQGVWKEPLKRRNRTRDTVTLYKCYVTNIRNHNNNFAFQRL